MQRRQCNAGLLQLLIVPPQFVPTVTRGPRAKGGFGHSAVVAVLLLVTAIICGNVLARDSSANGFQGNGRDIRIATDFLNDYSLAFAVHYACGRNKRAAPIFEHVAAADFSNELAGMVSPQLVALITAMQNDRVLRERACNIAGPLAEIFREPELTNALLNGLMWLSPNASGLEAFETGVYHRLRGYDLPFERYVEKVHRRLDRNLIVSR